MFTFKKYWFQQKPGTIHCTTLLPNARNQTRRVFKMEFPELPTALFVSVLVIRDYYHLRIWVHGSNFQLWPSDGRRFKDACRLQKIINVKHHAWIKWIQFHPHKTQIVSTAKTNRLVLFKELIAICSVHHTSHKYTWENKSCFLLLKQVKATEFVFCFVCLVHEVAIML
jgi:hypothetical protein